MFNYENNIKVGWCDKLIHISLLENKFVREILNILNNYNDYSWNRVINIYFSFYVKGKGFK